MSRRLARINELLREEISLLIMTEVKDPRINSVVTITSVDTSPDFRKSTVWFSSLASEKDRDLTLSGLTSSIGFLRKKLRERLSLRAIPDLEFRFDNSLEDSIHLSRLLNNTLPS